MRKIEGIGKSNGDVITRISYEDGLATTLQQKVKELTTAQTSTPDFRTPEEILAYIINNPDKAGLLSEPVRKKLGI